MEIDERFQLGGPSPSPSPSVLQCLLKLWRCLNPLHCMLEVSKSLSDQILCKSAPPPLACTWSRGHTATQADTLLTWCGWATVRSPTFMEHLLVQFGFLLSPSPLYNTTLSLSSSSIILFLGISQSMSMRLKGRVTPPHTPWWNCVMWNIQCEFLLAFKNKIFALLSISYLWKNNNIGEGVKNVF